MTPRSQNMGVGLGQEGHRDGAGGASPGAGCNDLAFLEDRGALPGQPAAWLFSDLQETVVCHNRAEVEAMLARTSGAHWVAALAYELGHVLEPATGLATRAEGGVLARFWRFSRCEELTPDAAGAWLDERLAQLPSDRRHAGVGGLSYGTDLAAYRQRLERIQDYIVAGDCYQVNFTLACRFAWFGDPLALYAALRQRQPVRYGGFVAVGGEAIVSLSPELFVERRGDSVVTRPMKGTAPRERGAEALRASEKDRAENLMIVDLLRNDLGRIAVPGSVRVDRLFEVEAYPTVWQMVSEVSARVPEGGLGKVLAALFPCGSVTGAPKIRAMQIIGELEEGSRGLYTGALGWIDAQGGFRLNVAIRTLELAADGSGTLGIGSGVVADSDAEDEWRECRLKAAFLTEHDPGLVLIETLRCEDGVCLRLEGHLARLECSATWFGFPFPRERIMAALAGCSTRGIWRVRLTLGRAGCPEATFSPLLPEPAGPRFARLALEAIDGDDPLRRHKTSVRGAYDRALATLADQPECFDVIFLNRRGEVAEGARSTVFVPREGLLLTPPIASGALPGVLRAELLASGRAREAVLGPADLAAGCFLGNALRGLVPVSLVQAP
ncbi:MAG: aminodeoxychorismate synthase component I [Azonexus sp.]|nr:aminodeoxychorismate synthase component I [Betaproteobacteria bacterium]MBK8917274.1 aminodeoxychorismate synthase component I [Betaproteobacteria bacterium]MBP6035037.1 aminodeoxychorismate synthase component I [Azonexus sp.]MBP6905985.1 aminodeoxychorismate synthase component I [Azonexus sp.]